MVYLLAAGNGGTGVRTPRRQASVCRERLRHKRRGLGAGGKRGSARGYADGEFQKITAFHDISSWWIPSWRVRVMRSELDRAEMNDR